MTKMQTVPLREQTEAAVQDQGQVVPLNTAAMPADPAIILTRMPRQETRSRKKILLWVGGGLLAAQALAPVGLKPSTLAGGAIADFSAQTMWQSAAVQEKMAQANLLAQRLADLQARHSEARAKCGFATLLSPEAGQTCESLVDQNFVPAIRQIEAQLQ